MQRLPERVEEQLKLALEISPIAALVVHSSGEILLANRKLEALFSYPDSGLIGKPLEVLVPVEVRPNHPELRDAYFDFPSPRSMGTGRELFGVSSSGEEIPVEIGLHPIKTNDGTFVMATVLDISERKRVEERFRLALDAAPSAILMSDSSGKIVLCNNQCGTVFGYEPDMLTGRMIEELLPSRFRRRHNVYRASYIQEPVPRAMGRGKDLWAVRADGSEFPVEVALQPVEMLGEQFVISSVLDVEERRAAEREIREQNRKLSSLNEELTAFAYSTSHDLKAPLLTIQGLIKFLAKDASENRMDEVIQNAGRIQAMVEKLTLLIEQMLQIAKVDQDRELYRPCSIQNYIQESLEKHSALREEASITVDTSMVADVEISTQPARLQSILDNLISNAFRYHDPEKTDRRVWIEVSFSDNILHLTIGDNGLGVPNSAAERIFKVFERGPGAAAVKGSGLGLSLVKKHLDRLGGDIYLDTSEAQTVFRLHVPDVPLE